MWLVFVVLLSMVIPSGPKIEIVRAQDGNQWNYVASPATECALLGQAGGGKSYGLNLDFLYDYEKPAHNGIIFRKTYRDLEDLIAKQHRIFPALGAKFQEQKHVWTFPSGSHLWMSYLDQEKDVYHYLGWEFSWIGWDELPQFSRMPYLFMMSRLRCIDPTIDKRVRSTGNADGPGVGWVWARFKDALPEGEIGYYTMRNGKDVRCSPELGVSRQWFFSTRSENKALAEADPNYEKNLDLLPNEKLRQAYKFGVLTIQDQPDQLIKTEWWEAAVNGKNAFQDGVKAFGMDYAELGHDKSICYVGQGNQPFEAREWDYVAHPAMAEIVRNIYTDHGKFQIKGGIDTVGTGAGVYTSLQALGDVYADRTNPIRYKDPDFDKKYDLGTIKLHFKNIQDQVLWKLREDFEKGNIDLSLFTSPEHYYENLELLREEVLALWYKTVGPDVIISSSNDLRKPQRADGRPSLGRSPDRLKALAIWNWSRDWTPRPTEQFNKNADDYGFGEQRKKKRPNKGGGFV
jgi:hypothetical protein